MEELRKGKCGDSLAAAFVLGLDCLLFRSSGSKMSVSEKKHILIVQTGHFVYSVFAS